MRSELFRRVSITKSYKRQILVHEFDRFFLCASGIAQRCAHSKYFFLNEFDSPIKKIQHYNGRTILCFLTLTVFVRSAEHKVIKIVCYIYRTHNFFFSLFQYIYIKKNAENFSSTETKFSGIHFKGRRL